jgi:hypothetical protein
MNFAERCHRQNIKIGFALLINSNLPQQYWKDAFQTAIYIINQLPIKVLKNQSFSEKAYKKIKL